MLKNPNCEALAWAFLLGAPVIFTADTKVLAKCVSLGIFCVPFFFCSTNESFILNLKKIQCFSLFINPIKH